MYMYSEFGFMCSIKIRYSQVLSIPLVFSLLPSGFYVFGIYIIMSIQSHYRGLFGYQCEECSGHCTCLLQRLAKTSHYNHTCCLNS